MDEGEPVVYYIPNRKLDDEERKEICEKIIELYKKGYWVEQKISLGEAGTIIILVKD